jgi:tetratricopeptide (TPR) repeat protein
MRTLVVSIFFLAAAGASQASELIFLKDGTVVKGEVTASTETSVTAVVGGTTYTVSADKFDPHFFYRVRDKALGNDAAGRIQLAKYAVMNDMFTRAKAQVDQAEAIDPEFVKKFRAEELPKIAEGIAGRLLKAARRAQRAGSTKMAKKYASIILVKFEGTKAEVEAETVLEEVQKTIDDKTAALRAQRAKMAQQLEDAKARLAAAERENVLKPVEKVLDSASRLNHLGLKAKGMTDAKNKFEAAGAKYENALRMVDKRLKNSTDEEATKNLQHLQQEARDGGVQAYLNAANAYSSRGSYQNATKMTNRALALDPNSQEAKSLRASVSTASGGWGFRRGGRR